MTKDELTQALYLFRDLWCQNIDLSTIDEFVDDYTQQQVKNLNIPAVSNNEVAVALLRMNAKKVTVRIKGGSKMNLKEAIEKLKWLSEQISPSPIKEAIDTVVAEVEKPIYTAEDMEAFAEFLIGRNTAWITELERNETAKTLIELWEKEMRKKED